MQEIGKNGPGRRGRRRISEMSVLSVKEDFGARRLPRLGLDLCRCAGMRSLSGAGKKMEKRNEDLLQQWLARSGQRRGQAVILVPSRSSKRTRLSG